MTWKHHRRGYDSGPVTGSTAGQAQATAVTGGRSPRCGGCPARQGPLPRPPHTGSTVTTRSPIPVIQRVPWLSLTRRYRASLSDPASVWPGSAWVPLSQVGPRHGSSSRPNRHLGPARVSEPAARLTRYVVDDSSR